MRILLTALDTLFFRDGKPFNRGEETWANGVFPPSPSVIYGALRSLYYTSNPSEIGQENTNQDVTKNLVINEIKIKDENQTFYHCPYDVVHEKISVRNKPKLLELKQGLVNTSSLLDYYLHFEKEVESINGFLLGSNFEEDYLQGKTPKRFRNLEDFVSVEPKVGIGRDNRTQVATEGLLYRVGMVRLKNIMIEVDFDLAGWILEVGSTGFLKIGGEGKTCSFEVVAASVNPIKIPKLSGDLFKIYFATPTILSNGKKGWLPSFLNEKLEGYWNGMTIKFLTAALGKPKLIGGFDMKEKRPKPMLKMIPEGAVLYFRIIGNKDKFDSLPQPFKLIDDEQKAKEGFGLAYLAAI